MVLGVIVYSGLEAWTQDTLAGDPETRMWASAGLDVWAWTCIATVSTQLAFQAKILIKNILQATWVLKLLIACGCWWKLEAARFYFLLAIAAAALAYLQHSRAKAGELCQYLNVNMAKQK